MQNPCRIELFGGLRLIHGDRIETRFRTQKTAQLLAFLACHRRHLQPRELLMDMLWPECEPGPARHSLSVALSALRSQLEPAGIVPAGSVLLADRQAVGLAAVTTDVSDFDSAISAAASACDEAARTAELAAAIDLFTGELLPGFYDEWILPERQRFDVLLFSALGQLISILERNGNLDAALQHAVRWAGADRLCEEAHATVIRLYTSVGRPDAAMRHYRELERILRVDTGSVPGFDAPLRSGRMPARIRAQALALGDLKTTGAKDSALAGPAPAQKIQSSAIAAEMLEPVGGAVPLGSRYYIERPTDDEFRAAITRSDSIVLVKGPRQVGKTSLLARGLQHARESDCRVVLTQLQSLNADHLESPDSLLFALAALMADQLDLEVHPSESWDKRSGANLNFRRFLRRQILAASSGRLVWGIDEVDRIFGCPFSGEIFALFRSWHDERALEPGGPWSRLTLAIAYSTEAHLFITDVNQSPFNVGTRLALQDFSPVQVSELNRRYGFPLTDAAEIDRFCGVVAGHPYLVSAGLHEMAARGVGIAELADRAASDDWIYGDHLRRIRTLLERDPEQAAVVRDLIDARPFAGRDLFYRLRSAGILAGESLKDARFRCPLYAKYLAKHLI